MTAICTVLLILQILLISRTKNGSEVLVQKVNHVKMGESHQRLPAGLPGSLT